ncbi:MAG TPA: VOC family protein [Actinophytocola sp.]|uniref:VOC family protein n=1 Tax=Actinophytocola sp. TaxID=1872138 RepID=UPI002DDD5B28|nr:VOC family protein [Actinophytocola sp.]HEV2783553.1 VOC family protein [Actinophytocola sp.]
MTIPQRLSFVSLGVRDIATLRRFYASWGWQERRGSSDKAAQFEVGDVRLALYPLDVLRDAAAPGSEQPGDGAWKGFTLAINLASRDAVDEAFRIATEAGGRPVSPPVEQPWGGYSCYVADPEGNRWEIAWAPGSS